MTNEQIDELLAEIGRAPFLTREEEQMLLKAVKEKGTNCDEMKRLEAANMRFVVSLANQYQHRGLTLEELIEAAKTGLREGIEQYNLEANNKLAVEAVQCMRRRVEAAIAKKELLHTSRLLTIFADGYSKDSPFTFIRTSHS